MNSMDDIQTAIAGLATSERAALMSWLHDSGFGAYSVQEPGAAHDFFSEDAFLSVEEYLAREEQSQIRHEFVGGRIFAMTGASLRHNIVSRNLVNHLSRHLAGGPCQTFMMDVKVRFRVNRDEIIYYPDVVVGCDLLDIEGKDLRNPRLVIEVLSPSTASIDRREKAFNYQQIPSLEEYVLVAQATPDITTCRRKEGWAPRRWRELAESAELASISLTLPLASVYDTVFI